MLLLDPEIRKRLKISDLPSINAAAAKELSLPFMVTRPTREELWQYLGFKHVNGPAKWGSYAEAEYIADVRQNFRRGSGNHCDTNRRSQPDRAAALPGDDGHPAGRGSGRVPARGSIQGQLFLLPTSIPGSTMKDSNDSCNLRTSQPNHQSRFHARGMRELGELCRWLYGSKKENIRPLIESQNPDLAILDEVLQKEAAVDTLRNGLPLHVARDVSRGDERIFRQALQDAKYALQKATGTLTTGFQGKHQDLLQTGREIAEIADDLVAQMERKSTVRKRRRAEEAENV